MLCIPWKTPPLIKIYEALGAIADGRVMIDPENPLQAYVTSSSGWKVYNVSYDPTHNRIMSNDNGSYFQWYLGYPAIEFLMVRWILPFREEYARSLRGIHWKNLNQQCANDFIKTETFIDSLIAESISLEAFHHFLSSIISEIEWLHLSLLGERMLPPKGY